MKFLPFTSSQIRSTHSHSQPCRLIERSTACPRLHFRIDTRHVSQRSPNDMMAGFEVKLPLPVSYVAGRYIVYDVNAVAYLRETWHMCGTLFGTLPQAQQQNVFQGLPLELMKEEVRLLVEKDVAIIVNDQMVHQEAVQVLSSEDIARVLAIRTEEQEKLSLINFEESIKRKELAIQSAKSAGKWKTRPPKEKKAEASSLFAEGDDLTPTEESIPAGEPKHTTADSGVKQYIIPMPSSSIGPFSLKQPEESLQVPGTVDSRYKVYKHLQGLGYFLSPGLRFGCQFLAYPGDPLRYHSHFLIKSLDWDEELPMLDMVGGGRLGTGVKKAWMIAGKLEDHKHGDAQLEEEDDGETVRTFCIEWAGFG